MKDKPQLVLSKRPMTPREKSKAALRILHERCSHKCSPRCAPQKPTFGRTAVAAFVKWFRRWRKR